MTQIVEATLSAAAAVALIAGVVVMAALPGIGLLKLVGLL